MIYYPLAVLMLAEIREILIISTPKDIHLYEDLLGNGSQLGLRISYEVQPSPDGLAQAFLIGEQFIGTSPVCMILGDNIFYGHGFGRVLAETSRLDDGAVVFGYYVNDPDRYGVVEFNDQGKVISLEEKPKEPKSNYAVTGLYFYGNDVVAKAKSLRPSARGELEITDLNRLYLEENRLKIKILGRGMAWLDTGTHETLLQASIYIQTIEERQGLKISCIEEIAYTLGYITRDQLIELARPLEKNQYGKYLMKIAHEKRINLNTDDL
jgi:glucose-1-phosphate thymidylyltransferase